MENEKKTRGISEILFYFLSVFRGFFFLSLSFFFSRHRIVSRIYGWKYYCKTSLTRTGSIVFPPAVPVSSIRIFSMAHLLSWVLFFICRRLLRLRYAHRFSVIHFVSYIYMCMYGRSVSRGVLGREHIKKGRTRRNGGSGENVEKKSNPL